MIHDTLPQYSTYSPTYLLLASEPARWQSLKLSAIFFSLMYLSGGLPAGYKALLLPCICDNQHTSLCSQCSLKSDSIRMLQRGVLFLGVMGMQGRFTQVFGYWAPACVLLLLLMLGPWATHQRLSAPPVLLSACHLLSETPNHLRLQHACIQQRSALAVRHQSTGQTCT